MNKNNNQQMNYTNCMENYIERSKSLDKRVICQEKSTRYLISEFEDQFNKMLYFLNIANIDEFDDDDDDDDYYDYDPCPDNILLIGEHGTGKTTMVNTLFSLYNIPHIILDASKPITNSLVSQKLKDLYLSVGKNKTALIGTVIFIDNFDKLVLSEKPINQTIIDLLEHEDFKVKIDENEFLDFFTEAALFVVNITPEQYENNFDIYDEYFYKTEFMKKFNEEDYEKLLYHSNSKYKFYVKQFKEKGIKIKLSQDLREFIKKEAVKRDNGVYGLNDIISEMMQKLENDLKKYDNVFSCELTKEYIYENAEPSLKFKKR